MISQTKCLDDPSGVVSKLIFEDEEAIAETVVYRYQDRGVVCFSVQSGCPVGCTFCGAGKTFLRNLSQDEIELQIETALPLIEDRAKVQLMSMSMGEPLYNFPALPVAQYLASGFYFFISSVGLASFDYSRILTLARSWERFGFQISLHDWSEERRAKMLGNHPNLAPLAQLVDLADAYRETCGRQMYFNYIAKGDETENDAREIMKIVSHGHITISVLCAPRLAPSDPRPAKRLAAMLLDANPEQSLKIFDPAGQDTIGGGCGQLVYVQEKFRARAALEQAEGETK